MELMSERPPTEIQTYLSDWPKVPDSILQEAPIRVAEPEAVVQSNKTGHTGVDLAFRNVEVPQVREREPAAANLIRRDSSSKIIALANAEIKAPEHGWSKIRRRLRGSKSLWPDPQLSTGTKCIPMGDYDCWEATGPAQELFHKISQEIADLLDGRFHEIEEGEPIAEFVIFGMYMIGKTRGVSRPTLVISCRREKPRRRAIKFIKESQILKGHPRIELAESSVVPTSISNDALRLFSGRGQSLTDSDTQWGYSGSPTLAPRLEGLRVTSEASRGIHGLPIVCLSNKKRATIGGIIRIRDEIYGLTVAHPFHKDAVDTDVSGPMQEIEQRNGDSEFTFDIDDDEFSEYEDFSDVDMSDINVTSQGSLSSMASLSRSGTTHTIRSKTLNDSMALPTNDVVLYDEEQYPLENGLENATKVGELSASSTVGSDFGYDWGLVKLSEEGLMSIGLVLAQKKVLKDAVFSGRIVRSLLKDTAVESLSNVNASSKGIISSSTTMMRLPYCNSFQEMWTVRLVNPMMQGDCGSWIIDAVSGDLYGHVVAGHAEGRVVYIVPAYKIIEDISKRLGEVELVMPSDRTISENIATPLPLVLVDKRVSELSHAVSRTQTRERHQAQTVQPLSRHAGPGNVQNIRAQTSELLQRLEEQHKAYMDMQILIHASLTPNQMKETSRYPKEKQLASIRKRARFKDTLDHENDDKTSRLGAPSTLGGSTLREGTLAGTTIFGSTRQQWSDDDASLYVEKPFPIQSLSNDDLREHLRSHNFSRNGQIILDSVITSRGSLVAPALFTGETLPQLPHYHVFNIGTDGAPLLQTSRTDDLSVNQSESFWRLIKDINTDNFLTKVVGRIIVVREPAPMMFAAIHGAMNTFLDMDEIFDLLVDGNLTYANMSRPFAEDARQQRSFVFSFNYFTIVGEGCQPMAWQLSDGKATISEDRPFKLTTCSSVVALTLSGPPKQSIKTEKRRSRRVDGQVYDTWAPWQVINIQCFADYHHTLDIHDSTKHYVNGPEVFMYTLLSEFRDAQKRFGEIAIRISKLITPGSDIIFSPALRDKLLFEDDDFTYSRRYFWAYQTLGTMNSSIKSIIDSYYDTFTDEVWEGKHPTLWPLYSFEDSERNQYFKKRMMTLKKDFDQSVRCLEDISVQSDSVRKEIMKLRDQLFSGTSVLESRKSVELSTVTILQGHNIKILTLVSIIFLPLSFVTGLFGMRNIPLTTTSNYSALF